MKLFRVRVNGQEFEVEVEEIQQTTARKPDNKPAFPKEVLSQQPAKEEKPKKTASPSASGGEVVKSPLPGTVIAVKVKPGDAVAAGDVLLILEAMKMENEIVAPVDGEVAHIHVRQGDTVETGDLLAEIV